MRRGALVWLLAGLALVLGCEDSADQAADASVGPEVDRGFPRADVSMDVGPDSQPDVAPDRPDTSSRADAARVDGSPDDALPDAVPPPAICLDLPPPSEQPALALEPRCRNGNAPLRIKDVRDERCRDFMELPTQQPGPELTIAEAVVSAVFDDDFVVEDLDGGPYSGVHVFNRDHQDISGVSPGTRVRLAGQLIEFYTLTELVLDRDGLQILGPGDPPEPTFIANPSRLADGGDLAEPFESRLVEIRNVRIATTVPDCPQDFGMFVVTGALRVDDDAEFDYVPARGDVLTRLVGVGHFSFDHYKILPRGDTDLDVIACGGTPDKCEAAECPVETTADETGQVIITEIQSNPRGSDESREYVELYNPGPGTVNLAGWRVQDCGGHTARLAGRLEARDYYLLVGSLDRDENGGVRGQGTMDDLFLPNGFGSVLVFDADGSLVDQVRYEPHSDETQWPERQPGEALQLLEPAADNREAAAWGLTDHRYGDGGWGTPGEPYRD